MNHDDDKLSDPGGGVLGERQAAPFDAISLTPGAVLEQLLTFALGAKGGPALASRLLGKFDAVSNVLAASDEELTGVDGMTPKAVKLLRLVAWVQDHGKEDAARPINAAVAVQPTASALVPRQAKPLPQVQAEMPLNVPGQTQLRLAEKPPTRVRKAIQDVLMPEGLMALKLTQDVKSLDDLQELLLKRLGQNSMETRRRYAQSIISWFFADGLAGLLPRVWQAHQDEAVAFDLLRWSYLNHEPIMGRCVADALFPCENGLAMPATYFDRFLQDCLGEAPPEKTRERLKMNLKRIGFLERTRGKPDRLLPVIPQKTSLLVLLHHLFAAKAVRTVELRNLFANPFWKYLGYKSEDAVRTVFREADAAGLIGKYVVADQLEQVTTCFTLDELLERKARL